MSDAVLLRAEEREVALAEAQAVYALAGEPGYRDELARLIAAVDEGGLGEDEAQTLQGLLEVGLQAGRIRAIFGPGGEQAALRLYRRLPRGKELRESAESVGEALRALAGRRLDSVRLDAVGPGAFLLHLAVDGADVSVRLDRQGARLTSVASG
jgi:hypothetical protein